jgi:superfamily II DNA or RNA helicase
VSHTGEVHAIRVNHSFLDTGHLLLEGELQVLLAPYGGREIKVDLGQGGALRGRLNRSASLLQSRDVARVIALSEQKEIYGWLSGGVLFLRPDPGDFAGEDRNTGSPEPDEYQIFNTLVGRLAALQGYKPGTRLSPRDIEKIFTDGLERYGPARRKSGAKKAAAPVKTAGKRPPVDPVVETAAELPPLPPVTVSFSPDEDRQVLQLARGAAAAPADLHLHRQALSLLLSPGFDTLLATGAARDIRLLDYQLATVRHVLKHLRGRALLCDEVGLGKTIEAGLIMLEYLLRGLVRRVLILTPPSLVEQWREEMQARFNLDFVTYDSPVFKNTERPWSVLPRIIASLDTAKREPHKSLVLEEFYDLVIVDEAHRLKQSRSQSYRLVGAIKKKYILLLTATPVENDLEELFNLITLLQPGQLETAAAFKKKYIARGDPLQPKNADELKKLVREVMVRNRRSETGVITSRRRAEVAEVTPSPAEARFYHRLTSFIREHYGDDEVKGPSRLVLKTLQREAGSSMDAVAPTLEKLAGHEGYPPRWRETFFSLAAEARGIAGQAKAAALTRILAGLGTKAVVFTGFRQTQAYLAGSLRREGLWVAELHGGMSRAAKEEQVSFFAREAPVLVSTETGSEGRNLQFCHVLVNYDLPWNPMRIEQRIGRIHRLGQDSDVRIYNLAAAGTVEAEILEILDAKINMFQLVVGELDMILGDLDEKRDFEDIVMDIWAGNEADVRPGMEALGERLASARQHYQAVRELDDRLLGGLSPED